MKMSMILRLSLSHIFELFFCLLHQLIGLFYEYEQAFFIDILVDIAKQTSRWIRVLGGDYDSTPSTFSADRIAHHGIVLLEPNYWQTVADYSTNTSFVVTTSGNN